MPLTFTYVMYVLPMAGLSDDTRTVRVSADKMVHNESELFYALNSKAQYPGNQVQNVRIKLNTSVIIGNNF